METFKAGTNLKFVDSSSSEDKIGSTCRNHSSAKKKMMRKRQFKKKIMTIKKTNKDELS